MIAAISGHSTVEDNLKFFYSNFYRMRGCHSIYIWRHLRCWSIWKLQQAGGAVHQPVAFVVPPQHLLFYSKTSLVQPMCCLMFELQCSSHRHLYSPLTCKCLLYMSSTLQPKWDTRRMCWGKYWPMKCLKRKRLEWQFLYRHTTQL